MKMDGPYRWEPPSYWYAKRHGGNYGFASEVGPGPDCRNWTACEVLTEQRNR